jgi:gliding motility-associated-like protein
VPTLQPSNFTHNSEQCVSVNLQWVNGNGSARLIVAKKGSMPDFAPSDNSQYTGVAHLGKWTAPRFGTNSDNFIVYNSNGTNSVKIDSLDPCSKYYFVIYEHDNNTSSTQYLITGAPMDTFTTYCTKLDFSVQYIDSCQIKNAYIFNNKSTSTVPGVKFWMFFADGDSSLTFPASHSYKIAGLIPAYIRAVSNFRGCQERYTKPVRVYQKKVVFIDFAQGHDTVQCLDGNLFQFKTGSYTNPLSATYGYRWFAEKDTLSFSFFKYSFKTGGRKRVSLEITTNISSGPNSYPTSCKDTLVLEVLVRPSPAGNISAVDTSQCLTKNNFFFDNPDNTLKSFEWDFGDGNTSQSKSVVHHYATTGTYRVIHQAESTTGCKGKDTIFVRVYPDLDTKFTGLDTVYCASNKFVRLQQGKNKGKFFGYPTFGDSIKPNQVGTHTIGYAVKDSFCTDTSFQTFRVDRTPIPKLGRDTAICAAASYPLSANETGDQFLWSTGAITQSILALNSDQYFVDVTEGKCTGRDSVNLIFTTSPKVNIGNDTILCKGGGMRLNANTPLGTYLWNTGSRDSFIYAFTPGKYVVTVTNPCGVSRDSIFINFQTDYCDLFMANAFSPGNDKINYEFVPRGRNITVKNFQIYNRWGELVFETDTDNVGWDGTYKGDNCPEGLYIWKLFYTTVNGPYIKKSNAFGQILLIR